MTGGSRGDRSAWGGLTAGLAFIAGVGTAAKRAKDPYPRPWAGVDDVQRYFTRNRAAARTSVAGQALSAVSLLLFTPAVARLARRAGSPGLAACAQASGVAASLTLATSAGCSFVLTTSAGAGREAARRLHRLGFAAGGPAHTAAFGALVGALGAAGARTGELPAPVVTTSAVAATAGVLSPLYYVARPFGWLIFAGRFPGLVVSAVAGVRLARGRPTR